MSANGLLQIALSALVLLALVKPLGAYMARVYEGKPCGLDRVLGPFERLIYRATGVALGQELFVDLAQVGFELRQNRTRSLRAQ